MDLIWSRHLRCSVTGMSPDEKTKKHPTAPETTPPREGDFAEEVAPKQTEFANEKDAKDITGGEFEKIP